MESPKSDLLVSDQQRESPKPGLLISDQQREIVDIINFIFVSTIVSLFGIGANIINIIIFCKQGFTYTVNISLCGLAVSDLCCLLTELWLNICLNPLFKRADIPFVPIEIQYLTSGVPVVLFSRITCWITVYITAERCLSIVVPLKVKQIITVKRATVGVSMIFLFNCLAVSPQYFISYLDWKFYPERNKTLVGLIFKLDEHSNVIIYISTCVLGLISLMAVILFTSILVVKLAQKSAWRTRVTVANEQSESLSNRDKRTMKMIILIASALIACYLPGTAISMVTIFEPQFSLFGVQVNEFFLFWSFAFVAQNVNASINIFLYYRMSTKYRQTFQELFSMCPVSKMTSRRKTSN